MEDKDYLSREKLTSVLDKNFIVEAGAGSGKTTALVKRLVAMVESGVDVSSISCITFTKAAANEFYERFQTLLSNRSKVTPKNSKPGERAGDLGPVTEESAIKSRKALNDIDLCFMGTIDSFVQKLMNEHPYEFNVPAKTAVISDEKVTQYVTEEYVKILNGEGGYETDLCESAIKASTFISKEVFVEGIKLFMRLKANETKCPISNNPDFDLDVEFATEKQNIEMFVEIYLDYFKRAEGIKPTNNSREFLKMHKALFGSWQRNIKNVCKMLNILKQLPLSKDVINKNNMTIPLEYFEEGKSNYKLRQDYIDDLVNSMERLVNGVAYLAMRKCASAISKKFQKLGYFTYADFIVSLRDSLRKDAANGGKIIKYIQQTRKYYMLDEFQDTNPLQVEIFFYLAAMEPKENYRDCHPIPGSLFIVGDPKQSIYRFTGADVQVFADTQALFTKDDNSEVLYLTRNFRSSKNLRDWFNKSMPQTLTTEVDNTNYEKIPLDNVLPKDGEATLNSVFTFNDFVQKKGRKFTYDYDQVSKLINTIVENPKYTILAVDNTGNKVIRTIKYKDIMLIAANKKSLKNYMASFAENGIPYFSEGSVAFEESSALNDVKALFYALVMPEKMNYLYRALLSKYVGLNESEIKLILANGNKLDLVNELQCNVNGNIIKKYAKLCDLFAKTKDFSYSTKFLYLVENTNLFERCSSEFMEYVYYAYELVKKGCEEGTIVTAKEAVDFVAGIDSSNKDYERCFSLSNDAGQGRVHLANLHKTKGLEAPVVILLYKQKSKATSPTFRTERSSNGTVTYIFGVEVKGKYNTTTELKNSDYGVSSKVGQEATCFVAAEELSIEAERRRLEYVAATRAMCTLLISNPTYVDESGEQIERKACYWDEMLDNTSDPIPVLNIDPNATSKLLSQKEEGASLLYERAENENLINAKSFESSFKVTRPSKLIIKKMADDFDERDDYTDFGYDTETMSKEEAAVRGTLAHRLMELLVNSKGLYTQEEIIENIKNEYVVLYENEKMLNGLYEVITNGGFEQHNGSVPDDILKVLLKAKNVLCEVPFSYMAGTRLFHGVIDVLYELEDGWHILDYKTNKEVDVEHLEDEYKGQLEGYIKAVEMVTGIKVKDASIYHLDC